MGLIYRRHRIGGGGSRHGDDSGVNRLNSGGYDGACAATGLCREKKARIAMMVRVALFIPARSGYRHNQTRHPA